jgi:hypothetical protein
MDGKSFVGRLVAILVVVGGMIGRASAGEMPADAEALVVRLVHPDRQAAEVLRLFDGARWSDPAAALAGWKQRMQDPVLSKPIEAMIALFNPEMALEWRALDDAEIRISLDPTTGELGWLALVPRDDGTLAAGITAMRLTYPDDRPIVVEGHDLPVARLSRSGLPLACQVGAAVVVASNRTLLERGVALSGSDRGGGLVLPGRLDSGTVFRLEPGRIPSPRNMSLRQRRTLEGLRAMGCTRLDGAASLNGGALALDFTTTLDGTKGGHARPVHPVIEADWLEAMPSAGVVAMVSMAIDPDPHAWDWAFATLDRVERVDPTRAGLAPLRSRLNLLTLAAGVKLEADLHPHLRGISACLMGDPGRTGRATGGLLVLHLDEPATAQRLVQEARPRLRNVLGANTPGGAATITARNRDIWLAWGGGDATTSPDRHPAPGRSLATICGGWDAEGYKTPVRMGAVWPARLWQPAGLTDAAQSSFRTLAEDPPVVWWGWSEPGREHDLLRWRGLSDRVRKFLETLPPGAGAAPTKPISQIPDSGSKVSH